MIVQLVWVKFLEEVLMFVVDEDYHLLEFQLLNMGNIHVKGSQKLWTVYRRRTHTSLVALELTCKSFTANRTRNTKLYPTVVLVQC